MFVKQLIQLSTLTITLSAGILIGCGPSEEEQAATSVALTAAAATNTPTVTPTHTPTPTSTPTPTPTPIPYDLSVLVEGEEEAPIIGATVLLAEVEGDEGTQNTDNVGQVFWYDLPGETVNLSISAQGYFPRDMTESVERGINQISVTLDRDPHGLLPSEACGPSEHLLYIEDFQDGEAQGWESIKLRVGGWDIGPHPDSQGNTVALNNSDQGAGAELRDGNFDGAVWRFQIMTDGKRIKELVWRYQDSHEFEEGTVDFSAYSTRVEQGRLMIFRSKWPLSNPVLLDSEIRLRRGLWHRFEISTFGGRLEVWLNGKRLLAYEDPEPLPSGTIIIGFVEAPGVESVDYIDNIVVCELSEPYTPIPTPDS
jgi:hypothetical protein